MLTSKIGFPVCKGYAFRKKKLSGNLELKKMELKVQGSQVAKVCRAEYLRGERATQTVWILQSKPIEYSAEYEYEDAS